MQFNNEILHLLVKRKYNDESKIKYYEAQLFSTDEVSLFCTCDLYPNDFQQLKETCKLTITFDEFLDFFEDDLKNSKYESSLTFDKYNTQVKLLIFRPEDRRAVILYELTFQKPQDAEFIQYLKGRVKAWMEQHDQIQHSFEEMQNQLSNLQEEHAEAQSYWEKKSTDDNKILTDKFKKVKRAFIGTLERNKKDSISQANKLNTQIKELDSQVSKRDKKIRQTEIENNDLKQMNQELQQKISILENNTESKQNEIEGQKSLSDSLHQQLKKTEEEMIRLQENYKSLEVQHSTLKEQLQHAYQQIQTLTELHRAAENETQQKTLQLREMQAELEKMQRVNTACKSELEKGNSILDWCDGERAKLFALIHHMEEEMGEKTAALEEQERINKEKEETVCAYF